MAQSKKRTRSTSRLLALEPRLLFDGAALAAAQDAIQPDDSQKDAQEQEHASDKSDATVSQQGHLDFDGSSASLSPQTVVLIDSRVPQSQELAAQALADGAQVHVVSASTSGLSAISDALAQAQNVGHLEIIAFANNGESQLGSDSVTSLQLQDQLANNPQWSYYASGDNADVSLQTQGVAQEASPMLARASLFTVDTATITGIKDSVTANRVTPEDTTLKITGVTVDGSGTGSTTLTISAEGGKLGLTGSGALTITTSPDGKTLTVTGSLADINSALANGLSFTPDADQNSSTDGYTPKINFKTDDTDLGNITQIQVSAKNDAPDFSTKKELTLKEGETAQITLGQLAAPSDPLNPESAWGVLDADIRTGQQVKEQLVIVIDKLPTNGTVTFKGSPVTVGQVIAAIDIDKLSYTASSADLTAPTTEKLGITVKDGGGGVTSGTIDFVIQPKNVPPSVANKSPSLVEGQTISIDPSINLGDSYDETHPHTIVIQDVVTGDQGEFSYTNAAGEKVVLAAGKSYNLTLAESKTLVFAHNGAEPNKEGAIKPSYSITVTDAGGGEEGVSSSTSGKVDVVLNITPNNDDPIFNYGNGVGSVDNPLQLPESVTKPGSIVDLKDFLKATDNDIGTSNQNLVYTLTGIPAKAEIQYFVGGTAGYDHDGDGVGDGWVTLGNGARFTQADIDSGKVRIMQTGPVDATTNGSFSFQVRDSAYGLPVDADGAIIPGGAPQEGAVRNPDGTIKNIVFNFEVIPDSDPDAPNTHPDGPHEPTPGYGTGSGNSNTTTDKDGTSTTVKDGDKTWTNKIEAIVTDPGNKATDTSIVWNEDNVGADGGYEIDETMLGYEITRSLDDGTQTIEMKVPPKEVVYTMLETPGNGSIQKQVDGKWVTVSTLDQFTQDDINEGRIRFVSNGSEVHDSTFKFAVSDGTNLSFTDTFKIDITPTNDRPTAGGGSATVVEGVGNGQINDPHTAYLGSSALGMSDADGSTTGKNTGEGAKDPLWFQITSLPKEGTLEYYNGKAWVKVTDLGNWYSQDLLTKGGEGGVGSGLRYTHNDTEPLTYEGGPKVSFEYQVRDDLPAATSSNEVRTDAAPTDKTAQGNLSGLGTVTINVTPVNNAPQIKENPDATAPTLPSGSIPNGGGSTAVNEILSVDESGTGIINGSKLVAIDSDNTTVQRQYQLTEVPA